jgi:hypothetical protein
MNTTMDTLTHFDKKANQSSANRKIDTRSHRHPYPTEASYFTDERLQWLAEKIVWNNSQYQTYLEENFMNGTYCGSTSRLVQVLKGLPEWAGLTEAQATKAIYVGLAKLTADPNEDPWAMLPDNEVNGMDAVDDFRSAWRSMRVGISDAPLENAFNLARTNPINWSDELKDQIGPIGAKMKLFCDACIYLQGTQDGYIILPQIRVAELLNVTQQAVSAFCGTAERAGFLIRVNGDYVKGKQAIRWRCTQSLERSEILPVFPEFDPFHP